MRPLLISLALVCLTSWPLSIHADKPTSPQGLAAYFPDQAVLFDGSTNPPSNFILAFKKGGYVLDQGSGGTNCPGGNHMSSGGVFLAEPSTAGVIAVQEPFVFGPALMAILNAIPPPADISNLQDDCEVLAHFEAVQAYLGQVGQEAQGILAQIEDCLQTAQAEWCEIMDLVDAYPGGGSAGGCGHLGCTCAQSSDDLDSSMETSSSFTFGCNDLQSILRYSLPQRLDLMRYEITRCEYGLESLVSFRGEVDECIALYGGVSPVCTPGGATQYLSVAEEALANAQEIMNTINAEKDEVTLEAAEASCNQCPGGDLLMPRGGVQVIHHRQPLGRFVGALRKAANATPDSEEAARFSDLARRLARVRNDRVLQVIYRADSAVSQHMVAVRSPAVPDDGSPVVIVLTALPREAPLPLGNIADERIILEAFRTFRDTLRPRPIDPVDPRSSN